MKIIMKMKKIIKMKKIKSFLSLLIFFVGATILISLSLPGSYAFGLNGIKNKNKNYGAYILKKEIIMKVNKNFAFKTYIKESVKILSQRGINKYSEVVAPFSTKYQKATLLYAYTLLKGGFKVPAGKHAVNIVSPDFAVNNPAYSDIKYLTVSMPAVEAGSVINFSYEINNFKPAIKGGDFYTGYFSYDIPINKIDFTLFYPYGLNLNLYLHKLNESAIHRRIVYIGRLKYVKVSISIKNIKAVKRESNMPSAKNFRKYIAVSTYTSWNGLLGNINKMFVKSEMPSEKIKKFVKSAVKIGKDNDNNDESAGKKQKEAAIAIYGNFVKSFRYIGIGYGVNGYKPEPAGLTFTNGYGDSKSLAALLITMLRIEGIEAEPVLISSINTSELNIKSVSPKQFDSVIVGLTLMENGKYRRYYLYPDSASYKAFKIPFSLAGRKGVLLNKNGFKFIKTPPEKSRQNEKIFLFRGKLNKNGDLKGSASLIYKGLYSNFERSFLKEADNYNKEIKVSDFLYDFIPGAYIKNFKYANIKNVNKNVRLKIKFSDKNYGRLNGDKLLFHLSAPADMELIRFVLKQKRLYPLIIGYPFEHIAKIKIKLPEKSTIYYMPPPLKIDNEAGAVYSGCFYDGRSRILNCFNKFKSKSSAISVKDYKLYRRIIRAYLAYLKNYFIVLSSVYFY